MLCEYYWVYLYALAVLTCFLGYQVRTLVTSPRVVVALLSVLDSIVIVLVYRGYWVLRSTRPE